MTKAELRRIAAGIDPTKYLDAREYLAAVYKALKAESDGYSYVRFTADLGFGECNAMHLIIHGQRPLTLKGARKVITALGLTGVARRYFLTLVEAQASGGDPARDEAFDDLVELKARSLPTKLDRAQLEFYNHWYNAAILELLSLPDASDDPAWISARLMPSVPPAKVARSLALLKRLGHLRHDRSRKRLVPAQSTLTTGPEVYGLAVMRYHQQMIALGRDALTDVDAESRDVSAVTIAVAEKDFEQLKEEIRALRRKLLAMSSATTEADQIVQVNIQMFPVARRSPRTRSRRNDRED